MFFSPRFSYFAAWGLKHFEEDQLSRPGCKAFFCFFCQVRIFLFYYWINLYLGKVLCQFLLCFSICGQPEMYLALRQVMSKIYFHSKRCITIDLALKSLKNQPTSHTVGFTPLLEKNSSHQFLHRQQDWSHWTCEKWIWTCSCLLGLQIMYFLNLTFCNLNRKNSRRGIIWAHLRWLQVAIHWYVTSSILLLICDQKHFITHHKTH